jgi:hypothetical protein
MRLRPQMAVEPTSTSTYVTFGASVTECPPKAVDIATPSISDQPTARDAAAQSPVPQKSRATHASVEAVKPISRR